MIMMMWKIVLITLINLISPFEHSQPFNFASIHPTLNHPSPKPLQTPINTSNPLKHPIKTPKPPQTPSNPLKPPKTPSNPLKPPQTPSNPLKPPKTPSNPLKPPQTPSNPLKPPQTPSNTPTHLEFHLTEEGGVELSSLARQIPCQQPCLFQLVTLGGGGRERKEKGIGGGGRVEKEGGVERGWGLGDFEGFWGFERFTGYF